MKKEYETPSFDYVEVHFTEDVLLISDGEDSGGGGVIIGPGNPDDW